MNLIEILLRVSPDSGNGSLELLTFAAIVIAISVAMMCLRRSLAR